MLKSKQGVKIALSCTLLPSYRKHGSHLRTKSKIQQVYLQKSTMVYDVNKSMTVCHAKANSAVACGAGSEQNKQSHWEAVVSGWQPYCMGWKQTWWECVACPPDVDDQQAFRQGTAAALLSLFITYAACQA